MTIFRYGEIVDVNLVRDKVTGKSKGFAFVAYEDQRSTTHARAANTGWGAQDKESKWGHEKFEGNKEGFRRGNKDSSFKPTGNGKALETHPKQSDRREEKSSRRHDNVENSREDNNKREEKRSRRQDTDEFEHGSIEDYERREEQRPRRHTDGEFELRSGGDQHRREENRPRRHGDEGGFERKPREDHNRREEKRPTRPDSESYTVTEEERTNGQLNGGILPLTVTERERERERERDDHRHKSDR
ncbi:hypothetical protein QYF36_014302 [Acer negundo]|nr:hypothetical protein QYF36_014302 [Acer negundo]